VHRATSSLDFLQALEPPTLTAPCCLLLALLAASLMSAVYEEMKDKDGFLYIKYSGENTFGGLLEAFEEEDLL
jgi:hypothetical protein